MVLFKKSGSYRSYHPQRTYRRIPSCTIFCSDQVKSYQNSTFVMRKVGCSINMAALLVGFLGDSVLKVDLDGVVKKKKATSGFGLKVMLGVSLCVSSICILQLSCGNIYKLE